MKKPTTSPPAIALRLARNFFQTRFSARGSTVSRGSAEAVMTASGAD